MPQYERTEDRAAVLDKHPDYAVAMDPHEGRVKVRFADRDVADSSAVLSVGESFHDEVYYFPRDDVDFSCLKRTDHQTYCPFKGYASYWSIEAGGRVAENAIWSYEDPFAEVAGLKDYLAFYGDRVDSIDAD